MFGFKNEEIIYVQKEGIEYIQFKKLLKYGVKHAYTLKGEGYDFGFASQVREASYEKLCNALEIDKNFVVEPHQTHTDEIKILDEVVNSEELQDVDGLMTDKKNIALTSKNADCILFVFFDPVKKVLANVHSGWRGTFKKIGEKAIIKMINYYGCKAEDILVFISPSIRKCHFEVEEDVKELCENIFKFTGKVEEFIELGKIVDGVQKYNIDTVLINKILFKELGIKDKNIIDCELCSVCNGDKMESVRVGGIDSGRATFIAMM